MTPSLRTIATLPYDFTDEVILTDEVSTVRFVAARLSPFKVYRAPIVRTAFRQPSRDIATRIVYCYCMRLKSHTFIFLFLLGLDRFMFLSSHGSSLVGLPFPPSSCLSVAFVYVTCAVSWLHRHVQRPNSRRRVQYFVIDHVVRHFVLAFFIDRCGERTCSGCLSCFSFVVDCRGKRT